MSVVMRIDVVKQKWIILVGVISFFALIIAIIIGAAGKSSIKLNKFFFSYSKILFKKIKDLRVILKILILQ